MSVVKRPRVVEHRVTRQVGECLVRFWIESDPEHGGIEGAFASMPVDVAIASMGQVFHSVTDSENLALQLLELVHAANSVEVVNAYGNGTAVHRD